jgi:hypothetical protein
VQDEDIIDDHTFPHKVNVELDMFCVLVLNEVGREVDGVEVAAATSRPPPRHWPRPGTWPRHLSGRQRSNTSKTRR